MSWSIRNALADVREWSVGSLECPGVVGRPSRMSGSGRKALPNVWEPLSDVRECLEGPIRCPGGPLTSGREVLSDVRE